MDYLAFKRIYHDDLLHFGIKRRSGRYPYGSGERPYQGETKKKEANKSSKEGSKGKHLGRVVLTSTGAVALTIGGSALIGTMFGPGAASIYMISSANAFGIAGRHYLEKKWIDSFPLFN